MNCKNCGHSVDGKFCSHCGQNSKVDRINLLNFLNEISESVFQINKGFFYTTRELFVRPGNSLNEFLNGKRKNHFKPIAYVLTLSTIYFLATQVTNQNTWLDHFITGARDGITGKNSTIEIPKMLTWFSKNFAYATLLLLPVFSLASYLSFFKFGKNYLEHFVVNSYITGQQAIFCSFFTIVGTVIQSKVMEILPFVMTTSYTFWTFWQLFSTGNRIINILRSIMTYVLYLVFSLVLLLGLMGISGMIK
jgi:hypothetical protein